MTNTKTFTSHFSGPGSMTELARRASGTENIRLGIRPFGFHAGNMVPLVAYPIRLCEMMTEMGKVPRFNFYLFLNDYEQHAITGPDLEKYEFNRLPADTTIQFSPAPPGMDGSASKYWGEVIVEQVREITRRFPETTVTATFTSELKQYKVFRDVVTQVLRDQEAISDILRKVTGKEVLPGAKFAAAICPKTKMPVLDNRVSDNGQIELHYLNGEVVVYNFEELDYWVDHNPMALTSITQFQIDLCLTGIDHLEDGDLAIRAEMIKYFGLEDMIKDFSTVYAPMIFDANGVKMSKSRGNTEPGVLDVIIQQISQHEAVGVTY